MFSLKSVFVAVALALGATSAQAVTFTVDAANSSVTLTETSSGAVCGATNCSVSADLAAGIGGTTFDLNNSGDTNSFDFLTFTGAGTGLVAYNIAATLAFDPPNISVTNGGSGGALLLLGTIIGAILTWDAPALVALGDGSAVSVNFGNGAGLFLGHTVTTSASITLDKVSAVPLPASALMLLLGLGGLAGVGRFRKKAA